MPAVEPINLTPLRPYDRIPYAPKFKDSEMSDAMAPSEQTGRVLDARRVDTKIEVAVIPVTNIDGAKCFYSGLGWRLDADMVVNGHRVIQFTPPGSPCSILFGEGLTATHYLVVSDIEAAREEFTHHGVEVGEIHHYVEGRRVEGLEPNRRSYASRAIFSDPDGNQWLFQEVTQRLPGRVEPDRDAFSSAQALAAPVANDGRATQTGQDGDAWPDWRSDYGSPDQSGQDSQ